jgi:hypothetical protein
MKTTLPNGTVRYVFEDSDIDDDFYQISERRAKRQELFTNHLLKIGMLMLVSFFGVAGVIMLLIQVVKWFQK